jgi:hypothetical protein
MSKSLFSPLPSVKKSSYLALSFVLAIAAVFGLAGGFALRGKKIQQGAQVRPASARESLALRRKQFARDDSPLATKLEHDLSMSKGVTRWLYWLEALEKAAPADFPRLAKLAQGNPALLRLVTSRWAELYPRHMFDWLVAESKNGRGQRELWEVADGLLNVWSKNDPEAAIAALSGPEDFGLRNAWRVEMANSIFDANPERGLQLMADWHIEHFGPNMGGVTKWAAADPRHAAEFTSGLPAFYASTLTMEAIGKEWAKTDPAGALSFAASHPGDLGNALASGALKQWGGRDLEQAANWLGQADPQTRNRLSPAFVEAWASKDASAALEWCQENLSGSAAIQAVGAVLKGAAEKDVAAAAALVTAMPPSPLRAEAALAVADKYFPALTSGPVKPEVIDWFSSLDPYSVQRALDRAHFEWSASDPASLAAFLQTPNAAEVSSSLYTVVARDWAQKDPIKALQWSASLSGDRALSAGSAAFAAWREDQPENATQWLNALPTDDPRRQPYFEDAVRTLAWNQPQAVEQFAAMSPAEQTLARAVVQNMTLPDDRKSALLAALAAH